MQAKKENQIKDDKKKLKEQFEAMKRKLEKRKSKSPYKGMKRKSDMSVSVVE